MKLNIKNKGGSSLNIKDNIITTKDKLNIKIEDNLIVKKLKENNLKSLKGKAVDILNKNNKNNKNNNKKNYRKNKILYNKDIFNKALDKIVNINQISLENRIEKETSNIDLSLLLTAEDKEFKPLLTQYCNKTGKELNNIDIDNLKLLIAVHGRAESLELLRIDACGKYSPLWLHSEPKTLNKLMYFDPCGFFVYAASHIFHCDIIKKNNISKTPPHSQAGKESTENADLSQFMADFPAQDKIADFIDFDMLADCNIRYFNLQDKILANRHLELYHDSKDITEVNELLRRFLGLANPDKVANLIQFSFEHLHEVTDSIETLAQFKQELKEAIKLLFTSYYEKVKRKKSEGFAVKIQGNNNFHSGTVAEIKAKFGGLSNFHNQPKIRNQSKKESILFDLKGFWDDETENNDLLKDFAGRGHSIDFNANAKGLDIDTGEPLNRFTVKKGLKIKLNISKKE